MSRKASLNPSKLPYQALLRLRGIPGSPDELSVMKNFFVDGKAAYELMVHSIAMAATTLPCDIVETGDGIVMPWKQYNPGLYQNKGRTLSDEAFQETRNKIRTAPLWGIRLRLRLMHDGASLTFLDAILRHRGEARKVRLAFQELPRTDQEALFHFLRSL
jgi:hypothetical protein